MDKPFTLAQKCYDYISTVTVKQGRLLDINLLYGDGTRFEKNYEIFKHAYLRVERKLKNGREL